MLLLKNLIVRFNLSKPLEGDEKLNQACPGYRFTAAVEHIQVWFTLHKIIVVLNHRIKISQVLKMTQVKGKIACEVIHL